MIAVSSFRPLGQNPEWDKNQRVAKASWDKVFSEVIYLNQYEEKLWSPMTTFLPTEGHPTIRELCRICAMAPPNAWACIINADIVVTSGLNQSEAKANRRGALALTSSRWTLDNGKVAVTDNGLDFFAARWEVWAEAAKACPPQLRIGHPTWDTWMLAFFNATAREKFYDITKAKCIFHPKHDDRRVVFNVDGGLKNVTGHCGLPNQRL